MENGIQLLMNSADFSFVCVSLFVNVGMKDDTVQGISHLTEHIIIEALIKKEPELFRNSRIDAYVEKEFTCFYAIVLRENVNAILKTFSQMFDIKSFELSKEMIEKQKNIIYEIENERVLSNARLINILLLEQFAFSSEVRNPIIVHSDFQGLNESSVKSFFAKKYIPSSKHLVVSGNTSINEIENIIYEGVKFSYSSNNICFDQKCIDSHIPIDRFDDVNDIRKTIALKISYVDDITEYYSIHIICMMYKVLINNKLKESDCFVQDITFKIYSEGTVLFFTYNKFFKDTLLYLKSFDIENCEELFLNIKKHFLFSYLQKSCELIGFNKEVYKAFRFCGVNLNNTNIVEYIQSVNYCNIVEIHKKIINGRYYFIKEDATCGCIRKI